jgi:PPOX class probable F420-dependent enzyme
VGTGVEPLKLVGRPGVACDLETDTALRRTRVGWLGTSHAEGTPHLVPVWFYWDGTAITIYSKRDARKVRNLLQMPDVAFAVEPRAGRMCSVLIEGRAEVLPSSASMELGFRRKYGAAIRRTGMAPASFAEIYPQAIRILPTRIQKYGDLTAPQAVADLIAAS